MILIRAVVSKNNSIKIVLTTIILNIKTYFDSRSEINKINLKGQPIIEMLEALPHFVAYFLHQIDH